MAKMKQHSRVAQVAIDNTEKAEAILPPFQISDEAMHRAISAALEDALRPAGPPPFRDFISGFVKAVSR